MPEMLHKHALALLTNSQNLGEQVFGVLVLWASAEGNVRKCQGTSESIKNTGKVPCPPNSVWKHAPAQLSPDVICWTLCRCSSRGAEIVGIVLTVCDSSHTG